MRAWQGIVLSGFVVGLLSCGGGGSGSTGLITSESTVVGDVRDTGTCDAFDGVSYCGSDSPNAVAPGGERVSVVTSAVPTATPAYSPTAAPPTSTSGTLPTPTSVPQSTATPVAGTPSPAPTATPVAPSSVTVLLEGFEAGAACAAASRPAGSDVPWATAALVPVAPAGTPTTFPLPAAVAPPLDVALACFDDPPPTLPAELVTLADADPTVVFVLPSP